MLAKVCILASVVTPASCDRAPPNGLVFKNATEIKMELERNVKFEEEWLEGNYKSSLEVSYSMSNCDQECTNWCWATSASMAASVFGGGSNCNKNEEAAAGHEFGLSCSSSCSSGCNQGGTTAQIADAIKFLSSHSYTRGGVLSQSSLDSALKHGPVVLAVQWTLGGGHAITISGVSGGTYTGHDPEHVSISTNYGGLTTYKPPYASGKYTGKWVESAYTNSGAALVYKDPPRGLIIENATEMKIELERNAQFEQEFLHGNYKSSLEVSYSMSNCDQECTNWCWATSASMAASVFGGGSNCNKNEEAAAGHEFGLSCSSRVPGPCQVSGCNKGGTLPQIADAIKFLSSHSYSAGGVLSQSSLDSALKHGPVVLGVQWTLGGGHAITISGVSGGTYTGHDPEHVSISTNYGGLTTYKPPYASGKYTGKWFGSVYTNSGADVIV